MTKKNTNISSFESDLKKLQDILEDIESDKLSLEQSIEKYKEGVELSKKCQKALDEAKQIIKVLDDENNKYPQLDKINSPNDLKKLDNSQLKELSDEIRSYILEVISQTGGHLAAGLGTVELSISLHYVFNTPTDKIIWDVGHQCYPHKILTGRKDKMLTIRKYKGISGFLKMEESEYDVFGAGHSSTSISAALGMAIARDAKKEDHRIISVIGDGGITAGMSYEALCHAGYLQKDMLVILNDNEMSISPNVGAMNKYLTKILSGKLYQLLNKKVVNFLEINHP